MDCLMNNKIAEVYSGLYRNSVYIGDVLDLFRVISEYHVNNSFLNFPKIINVVGNELLSRADMVDLFSLRYKEIKVKIVDTPKEVLLYKPNKINAKSLYFDKIKKSSITNYKDFIIKGGL